MKVSCGTWSVLYGWYPDVLLVGDATVGDGLGCSDEVSCWIGANYSVVASVGIGLDADYLTCFSDGPSAAPDDN